MNKRLLPKIINISFLQRILDIPVLKTVLEFLVVVLIWLLFEDYWLSFFDTYFLPYLSSVRESLFSNIIFALIAFSILGFIYKYFRKRYYVPISGILYSVLIIIIYCKYRIFGDYISIPNFVCGLGYTDVLVVLYGINVMVWLSAYFPKVILLCVVLSLSFSCNISRSLVGNYQISDNVSMTKFSIYGDNSFDYCFRGEGTGRKDWSYGKWEQISNNRAVLNSIRHDSLPIIVSEYMQNIENKLIIFSKEWCEWDLPITLIVNGKKINITGRDQSVLLSDDDFPIVERISVMASLADPILSEMANFTTISTITYNVGNSDNNIFYISFPFDKKLYEFFYLKELNDTVTIKRNSLWRNNICNNNGKYKKL